MKNTKKTISSLKLALPILFILLISIVPVSAFVDSPNLGASLTRYDPLPAQPGQYVTVYVQIENNGIDDAPDAAIKIEDQFPFSVTSESDRLQEIGILKGQKSYVAEFKLKISSDAAVGVNNFKVKYTTDMSSDAWKESVMSISIKNNDAGLSITNVKTTPDSIPPGTQGVVSITVKNTADITLRNIALQTILATTQGIDLPFIPLSGTQKRVARLNPNEQVTLDFPIQAYPDASPGYYKIPLMTSFYDDEGNALEQNDVLGVIIKAEPELKIYSQKVMGDKVTLQFVNKGINDLKFLEVGLLDSKGYKIETQQERYIGDLDSDDYRTETFTISLDDVDADVKVYANFKDENNNAYTKEMTVQVSQHEDDTKSGLSPLTIIIILVFVGVLAYYFYKRNKKKNSKKK